jgi:hypothetical protein
MQTETSAASPTHDPVVKLKVRLRPQSLIVLALAMAAILACASGTTPTDTPGDGSPVPVNSTEEGAGATLTSRPPTVAANNAPVSTQPEAVCSCREDRYNCADFTEPNAAQQCFQYCLQEVGSDVHLLDADGNRVVCESVWPGWATPGGAPRATYTPFRFPTSTP